MEKVGSPFPRRWVSEVKAKSQKSNRMDRSFSLQTFFFSWKTFSSFLLISAFQQQTCKKKRKGNSFSAAAAHIDMVNVKKNVSSSLSCAWACLGFAKVLRNFVRRRKPVWCNRFTWTFIQLRFESVPSKHFPKFLPFKRISQLIYVHRLLQCGWC